MLTKQNHPVADMAESPSGTREWFARLQLAFDLQRQSSSKANSGRLEDVTVLKRNRHEGPLRVQRIFQPQPGGPCHVYILHPPGGLVVGDQLVLEAQLEPACQALLTTPSAGKCYGVKDIKGQQKQYIKFDIREGASLEWLPQETIIFRGARAALETHIHLEEKSQCIAWDILRLGRVAGGEKFDQGAVFQTLKIFRSNKPLHIERNTLDHDRKEFAQLAKASFGFRSASVVGTCVAAHDFTSVELDEFREKFASVEKSHKGVQWALTQKKGISILRYLGDSPLECREGFENFWKFYRRKVLQLEPYRPRVWDT